MKVYSSVVIAVVVMSGSVARTQAQTAYPLEPMRVEASPYEAGVQAVSWQRLLEESAPVSAAEAVENLPGVSAVRRSASACEPVVRGLGWERVVTQFDGLPLVGGCPSRMDPPAMYVSPQSVDNLVLIKALPSVTLGPGGTGGRILLSGSDDEDLPPLEKPRFDAGGKYDGARDGGSGYLRGEHRTASLRLRGEGSYADLGDYEGADGTSVPADHTEYGGSVAVTARPAKGHTARAAGLWKEYVDADYPALPMDTEESTTALVTAGYERAFGGERDAMLGLRLGFSDVDHLMNNKNKPNRRTLIAETPTDSQSFALTGYSEWEGRSDALWKSGLDVRALRRDGTRSRTFVATGQTLFDPIWPDVEETGVGGYAEVTLKPRDDMSLRVGARVDWVDADANAADDVIRLTPASPPRTIRESYAQFYGPDAADVARDDVTASGNVLWEWQVQSRLQLHAGAGVVSRSPNLTERYFAFAPAPGGYRVGNPTLDPEKKLEADFGATVRRQRWASTVGVFASRVYDYIYETGIARQDVNADGIVDVVKGFNNVDANLYGGEWSGRVRLPEGLSVPFHLSYVRGRNTTNDRDLPEIPPLNGAASLRWDGGRRWLDWLEFGYQFAARQDRVDETFPEDETPAWNTLNLRAGFKPRDGMEIEVGVENLLDEAYHLHLTREALLPVGDLAAGDEIPEPGRYVYVAARLTF